LRAYDAGESWGSQPEEAEEIAGDAFIEADLSDPDAPALEHNVDAAGELVGPEHAAASVITTAGGAVLGVIAFVALNAPQPAFPRNAVLPSSRATSTRERAAAWSHRTDCASPLVGLGLLVSISSQTTA
jgi:hypothetical protein